MIDTTGANVPQDGRASNAAPSPTGIDKGEDADILLTAFYINRDCDNDRRASIERQLAETGVVPERIAAINALEVPGDLRHFFFDGDKLTAPLNPGEVGCYASHLKSLRSILEKNLDYALILEDDALVPSDITTIVKDITERLPPTWDVVHLCGTAHRAVRPVAKLDNNHSLVRYSRIPSGAFGYLVSRTGAAKLLRPIKRYWPFDTDLRRPWLFNLQVYGVDPKVITHGGTAASVIIAVGGRSRARRGLPIPSRVAWTGNPLHCPEGVYFNFKTLGPIWWFRCWLKNISSRLIDGRRLVKEKQRHRQQAASSALTKSRTK